MPDKPTTAEGYGPDFLERSRRTCLHVATVIGDMIDEVVLVPRLPRLRGIRVRHEPDLDALANRCRDSAEQAQRMAFIVVRFDAGDDAVFRADEVC